MGIASHNLTIGALAAQRIGFTLDEIALQSGRSSLLSAELEFQGLFAPDLSAFALSQFAISNLLIQSSVRKYAFGARSGTRSWA